jgi:hypothetical protein
MKEKWMAKKATRTGCKSKGVSLSAALVIRAFATAARAAGYISVGSA